MFLDHGHGGLDDVDLVFGERHIVTEMMLLYQCLNNHNHNHNLQTG